MKFWWKILGCDPNIQLPIGKKTNVRINACGRSLSVTVGSKVTTCKLPGPLINQAGKRNLYLNEKHYRACSAKLGDLELFQSLAPVFAGMFFFFFWKREQSQRSENFF